MQNNSQDLIKKGYSPTIPYLTPERNQKFFGIVLTLCALSFFGFFAIRPTVSTILKLQKELSDNQFVLDQLKTKIKNLQNFEVEISSGSKGTRKDYYAYSFSIAGTGSFENISKFISTLTNMERIVNIDVFSINMTDQDSGSLGFDIQGSAFFK